MDGLRTAKRNYAVHIVQVRGHNTACVQLNYKQALPVVAQRIHE